MGAAFDEVAAPHNFKRCLVGDTQKFTKRPIHFWKEHHTADRRSFVGPPVCSGALSCISSASATYFGLACTTQARPRSHLGVRIRAQVNDVPSLSLAWSVRGRPSAGSGEYLQLNAAGCLAGRQLVGRPTP